MSECVYKYYVRRPVVPGAVPNDGENKIVSVTNYDGPIRLSPGMGIDTAWGEVLYASPLSEQAQEAFELVPDRHNCDVWNTLCELADAVGEWEAKNLPEPKRLTWFYSDFGSYVPNENAMVADLKKRKRIMELSQKKKVPSKTILAAI